MPDSHSERYRDHRIVQAVLTYVVVRAVTWALGFRYNPFTDGLDIPKLIADLALWAGLWIGFGIVIRRITRATPRVRA